MMNLSDVKTYLINYFGNNPFDYNKYKTPVKNELPYILSDSCATTDIKLDLSNTTTYTDEDPNSDTYGFECTDYQDGTTYCENTEAGVDSGSCDPNVLISTKDSSDGTKINEYWRFN